MRSMEYCTGLFVWGLEVCAHLVVGGVCVAEVHDRGLRCWGLCVFVIKSLHRSWEFSSTLSRTSALDGGGGSAPHPGRTLPPGKTRYPLYRRVGGPQVRSGRGENLVPTGILSRTVQPVVSRCTD